MPTKPEIVVPRRHRRMGTVHKSEHHRIIDGRKRCIWISGVGEVDLEPGSRQHREALEVQPWLHNYLADGGENSILDVYFRAAAAPSLYIALLTADPGETGTLAGMSENAGTGYSRIQLNRNTTDFPTLALDGGDYKVTSTTKVFTAGGTWSACTHLALVTAASGTSGSLILVNALGATRSLINTDTLTVTVATKLQ